jgi:molybdenum cofactor cytidylyltransferase
MNPKKQPYSIAAAILAAGQGSRFGSQKMLHQYNGKTLLEHSLAAIDRQVFSSINIVCGSNAEQVIQQHQSADCHFIINKQWQAGMGTSIAAAIEYFEKNQLANNQPVIDAVLIILGDQIHIDSNALNTMAATATANPNKIVCAKYNNINGAPAIFPAQYFNQLKNLPTNNGAKTLLNAPDTPCISIELIEAGLDIDYPEDLQAD